MECKRNNLRKETLEFAQLLNIHKIDIALIAETKLQDEATWRIPNYDIYKTEGPTRGHGGTAVVVKSTISHAPVTINGLENIQMTAIEIHPQDRRIIIGAVYIPPAKELLRTDLDSMTNFSNDFIFGGDFNAQTNARTNARTNKQTNAQKKQKKGKQKQTKSKQKNKNKQKNNKKKTNKKLFDAP